jgi:hypothetical protein
MSDRDYEDGRGADVASSVKERLSEALSSVVDKISKLGTGGASNAKKTLMNRKAQLEAQIKASM